MRASMKGKRGILCGILFLMLFAAAAAAEAQTVIVSGYGVRIFDVSNPASPQQVGGYRAGDESFIARGVDVQGNYAYLAENTALVVLNIADVANPVVAGTLPLSGSGWDVDVDGQYAYVATLNEGLKIVDVASPAAMSVVGAYANCTLNRGVAVQGDYAYLACNMQDSELRVINVSDRAHPVFLSRGWSFGITGTDAAVNGGMAVLAVLDGYITMFNTTSLQGIRGGGENHYDTLGDYRSNGNPYAVKIRNGRAYIAAANVLEMVDVSQGSLSRGGLIGSLGGFGSVQAVEVQGSYAYVADNFAGLKMVDVANAAQLQVVGNATFFGAWDIQLVEAAGAVPYYTAAATDAASSLQPSTLNAFNLAPTYGMAAGKWGSQYGTLDMSGAYNDYGNRPASATPLGVSLYQATEPQIVEITTAEGMVKVYVPANDGKLWSYYVASDGSTYYAVSTHSGDVKPDMSAEEAITQNHLARKAGSVACTPQWACFDAGTKGYQNGDCSWSQLATCAEGCLNGECRVSANCGNSICEVYESVISCPADCRTVQITTEGHQQRKPEVSDRAIVWWDDRNAYTQQNYADTDIYAFDLQTGEERRLTSAVPQYCTLPAGLGGGAVSCSGLHPESPGQWSPDISGTKVVYEEFAHVCYNPGPPPWSAVCRDVYLYDFATGNSTVASSKAVNQVDPRISDNHITWFESDAVSGLPEVWWHDLSTATEEFVGYGQYPDVDGNYIAYMAFTSSSDPRIGVYNVVTKEHFNFSTAGSSQFPRIDGKNIVYNAGGNAYVYDITTRTGRKLTTIADQYARNPTVSGNNVVYQDYIRNGDGEIYAYDLVTSTEQRLEPRLGVHDASPSAHNGKVVFTSNPFDNPDVMLRTLSTFSCGDGMCLSQIGETTLSCPADCGSAAPPPSEEAACGNGICEGNESVASCFIDCAAGTGADSCSAILPLPEGQGTATATTTAAVEEVQTTPPEPEMNTADNEGRLVVLEQGNDSRQYIVELAAAPEIAVHTAIDNDIRESAVKAEQLERRIAEVDTSGVFGVTVGSVRKFLLGTELREVERGVASLQEEKPQRLAEHRQKLRGEHEKVKAAVRNEAMKEEFTAAFNGMKVEGVSEKELEALRGMPEVKRVVPDQKREIDLTTSVPYIRADNVWKVRDASGEFITGKGKTIAVIDTGVDYTHPDLGGCFGVGCKVIGGYDFTNRDANPMDDHGHGTHVAATAAGNGVLKGVAPDAGIYAYKVCNSGGSCWESDIIAGIERAMDPNNDGDFSDHVDVISISLGGGGTPDDPDALAVDSAFDAGIVVAVSAGNSGPGSGTVKCPACARKSIAVAAWCRPEQVGVDSRCPSPIASFSSRGPVTWPGGTLVKPDIAAPGVMICAAEWDSAWSAYRCVDSSHVAISGTSMAAPHVSGAAALIRQAHPDWTPQQVKDALMESAVDLGLGVSVQGAGLLDVFAAINVSDTLPQAVLSTTGKVHGRINISGTAAGVNFSSYTLEYGAGSAPASWQLIAQSLDPVVDGELGQWDTMVLSEGTYTLRLSVSNARGEQSMKTSSVDVDNVFITAPEQNHWMSAKDRVEVNGTVLGSSFVSYKLEYGSGTNPASWSTEGVMLSGNGRAQGEDELLATWNASVVEAEGFYTLRLSVEYLGGGATTEMVVLYVDPSLQKGWPVTIPENCAVGMGISTCYAVLFNPTIADVDADGKQEILTATHQINGPMKTNIFRYDGSSMPGWPVEGDRSPAVSDVNSDGVQEIIAIDKTSFNNLKVMTPNASILARAFALDDNPMLADIDRAFPGEEIITSTNALRIDRYDGTRYFSTIHSKNGGAAGAVGDINNDGMNEMIIFNYTGVWVFRENGSVLPGWPQNTLATYIYSRPVIGDLDGDGMAEIVMGGNDNRLYAWHHNGSAVQGFPVSTGFLVQANPALGDVDGNGDLEIVVTDDEARRIYVYSRTGQLLPGWPREGPGTTAVIGDIDGDGKMEIIDGNYAYHHDGTLVSGFPKKIRNTWELAEHTRSSAALADLDGDGDIELVIGPTEFDFRIYVYDLPGPYRPENIEWGMVRHDARHTGDYNAEVSTTPQPYVKYYYYNLTDNNCFVNLTASASTGNVTLSARFAPNVCDDTWDATAAAGAGGSAVLTSDGLVKGSYALRVSGVGQSSVMEKHLCREDATPPAIVVEQLPQAVSAGRNVSASVADSNGLKACRGCVSSDGVCDTEWSAANVVQGFAVGDRSGSCVLNWNAQADGSYTLNLQVEDVGGLAASGAPQVVMVDSTAPQIHAVSVPFTADKGAAVAVKANISDATSVNATVAVAGNVAALLYDPLNKVYAGAVIAPLVAGMYNVSVVASDSVGNRAESFAELRVSAPVEWAGPVKLAEGAGSAAAAMDGTLHIAYESKGDVYYTEVTASGEVRKFGQLLAGGVYNARFPAVAAAGNVHVAWQDDRDGNGEIYYANPQTGVVQRVTFNSFASAMPEIAAAGTGAVIVWQDNRSGTNDLYYAEVDAAGVKVKGDTLLAGGVEDTAVAGGSAVYVAWVRQGQAYYGMLNGTLQGTVALGPAEEVAIAAAASKAYVLTASQQGVMLHVIGNATKTIALAEAGERPSIAASDEVHMLWNSPATYAKADREGNILSYPRSVSQRNGSVAAGQQAMVLLDSGRMEMLTTAALEQRPPLLQAVVRDVRSRIAVIDATADEPADIMISYSSGNATGEGMNYSHRILADNLEPQKGYAVTVTATDAAGNSGMANVAIATPAESQQPALPTTFYGRVMERDGIPVGGVRVTANWVNVNGNAMVTEAVTLEDGALAGYYLFNRANVNAKEGSIIVLTAPDMANNVTLPASPGNLPLNVTAPLILDRTPPAVSVHQPAAAEYTTPLLVLNFTVNEPTSYAEFVLNGNAPVVVTGYEGQAINITARLGQNTLTVAAKDQRGLWGQTVVSFTVRDTVPPSVAANARSHARNVTVLTANVSDATNALQSCDVCIGQACAWQPSQDDFDRGNMQGTCSYAWDTKGLADGSYSVQFRAADESGNTGTADAIMVRVDNTPPQEVAVTIRKVEGQQKLVVQWPASSDEEFRRYVVYRSKSPAVVVAAIENRSTTVYEDTNVFSGETYGYAVVVEDAAGNSGGAVFGNGTVADVTAPNILVSEPSQGDYNAPTVPLVFSASEPGSCAYVLNGAAQVPVTSPTTITGVEGTNTIVVYCTDASNNTGLNAKAFRVDTTPPNAIVPLVAAIAGQNSLRVSWEAPVSSDTARYNVYRSDEAFATRETAIRVATLLAAAPAQYVDTNLASGRTYYYAVTAVDTLGNERASVMSVAGTVADTVAPIVMMESPQQRLYTTTAVPLQYAGSEPLQGCAYEMNGAAQVPISSNTNVTALEGSNHLTLACTDAAGNKAVVAVDFDVDAEVPAPVQGLAVSTVAGKASLKLAWSGSSARDLGSYRIYRSSAPFTATGAATMISSVLGTQYTDNGLQSEASYHYAVTAADRYGNEDRNVVSVSATVPDIVPPARMAVSAAPVVGKAEIALGWNRSEAADFDHYTIYRSGSSFTNAGMAAAIATITNKNARSHTDAGVASDRTYYYAIIAADRNGNEDKMVTATEVRVYDLTPPQIVVLEPQNKTYMSRGLTLSMSSSEQVNCTYVLNGAAAVPFASTAALVASEGGNSISVSCIDKNGNSAAAAVVFSTDTIAPPIITGLRMNAVRERLNVSWNPSPAQDISGYRVYIGTSNFTTASQSFLIQATNATAWFRPTGFLSEQTYYVAVTAVDKAGNENMTVVPVNATTADTIPPNHVSGLTANGMPNTTNMLLQWWPSSSDDVSHYIIYRDRAPFIRITSQQNIANATDVLYMDRNIDGEYWYAVAVIDIHGNVDDDVVPAWGMPADMVPPNVSIVSPQPTLYAAHLVPLAVSTEDMASCSHSLNNGTEQKGSMLDAEEGMNTVEVRCWDAAGNRGTAAVNFETDTMPPLPLLTTVQAAPRAALMNVTWQQSSDGRFAAYTIYRSSAPFTNTASASPIAAFSDRFRTALTDTGVQSGQTYYYGVAATDTLGNVNSSVASAGATVADIRPPVVSISSPAAGAVYAVRDVLLRYSADEPVQGCSYALNGEGGSAAGNMTLRGREGQNALSVRCSDMSGNNGSAAISFAVNAEAPAPVTGLMLSWGSVVLSWDASSATDLWHYAVYRGNASFSDVRSAERIATTTAVTYRDEAVESEMMYWYAVTAIDTQDNENTAVVAGSIITPDRRPPAPVEGPVVSALSGEVALQIDWVRSAENDFANYHIYRSSKAFANAATATLVAGMNDRNAVTYKDTNLESGRTYYYAVTAVDSSGNENKSVVAVRGTVADTVAPIVTVLPVASPVGSQVVLRASVEDEALAAACEVCVTKDVCTWAGATSEFAAGSTGGICSHIWTAPPDGGTYWYNFRVNDIAGNTGQGVKMQMTALNISGNYTAAINLYAGWNLISFPVLPQDNRIAEVFAPLQGKYTRVFAFDGTTKGWETHFAEQNIFNPEETLRTIDVGRGYWVEMNAPGTLQVTGTRLPVYSATLNSGWGLIGHPFETTMPAGTAFASLNKEYNGVFAFNATAQKWERYSPYASASYPNTLERLEPGRGYMIDMRQDSSWTPQRQLS